MRDAIGNMHRMREVVGDRADLLVEIHRRLTPAEAITFAHGIEDTHPMFLEDPIRPEGPDAMARVAGKINIPIATGERFLTIYEFEALLARSACEFARVDVCTCGGITGARRSRSEEHTSELQSRQYLVCRLLLEKKKRA